MSPRFTLNYGLRYDYSTPLTVKDDLLVNSASTPARSIRTRSTCTGQRRQLPATDGGDLQRRQDRAARWLGHVRRAGPGEDLIQPIESDRVNTTLSTGPLLAFPINTDALVANFTSNPRNRSSSARLRR